MSHRFAIDPDAVDGDEVRFTPDQAHQIQHVLRLRPGDLVRVFDGLTPHDRVVRLSSASQGAAEGVEPHAPEPRVRLVAYPALLSRDKFETVLQKLTELGVSQITPVITTRALVREAPDERRLQRWRAIVREASEQSGRGRVPDLPPALPFAAALRAASADGPTVLAYERERTRSLRDVLRGLGQPDQLALFVGPEGGYTADEVALAETHGAHLVSLGPRILRTETASPVLAALVLYELGDLSSGPP